MCFSQTLKCPVDIFVTCGSEEGKLKIADVGDLDQLLPICREDVNKK